MMLLLSGALEEECRGSSRAEEGCYNQKMSADLWRLLFAAVASDILSALWDWKVGGGSDGTFPTDRLQGCQGHILCPIVLHWVGDVMSGQL